MKSKNFCAVLVFAFWSAMAFAESIQFGPEKGVAVTLVPDKTDLTVTVQAKNGSKDVISFQTEKVMHVEVGDYNFDGFQDFSVWYIDDGMGTYSIHRIFVYAPKNSSFKELKPACGDEFLNLKVNKEKKILRSMYYKGNVPTLCVTKPSRK
ncbi:hypothetical protein LOY38_28790 [Pseudomonas sp. B21-015]|uniref:XAC2610-related protein n=1 Tax=Pseudomonas sp. B21-015 TaxID=2895473 RepID=UPI00215F5BA3|nr:hypothetical protein [Pseudomonas sp. B21-015]UVM50272.1 hypothetical protein LOY38_28790 [Pseudomonas sp. B21-015]